MQLDPKLAEVLRRASRSDFASYDPRAVIDAVNALQPLGKEGALAAIGQFVGGVDLAADPHQGLFLVPLAEYRRRGLTGVLRKLRKGTLSLAQTVTKEALHDAELKFECLKRIASAPGSGRRRAARSRSP